MKIARVQTILLSHMKELPPMRRSYAVVRVETDDGLIGYGEASSNYGHSYPTVIRAIVDDVLAPNLIGRGAADIRLRTVEMHGLLDGYLGWEGVGAQAIGAVEIALWDIAGKAAGVPIARLLGGGSTGALRLYATGTTMFDATPDWYAHYFDAALVRGIDGVKVRLGVEPEAAVARVAAVRAHVGRGVRVMMDAYWGYAPADALALARRVAPLEITFFEEPSPQQTGDLDRLAREFPMPIAVGERVYTPSQFERMALAGTAQVLEPDACICGGIAACMEVAALGRRLNLPVVPHFGSPTAIGFAANLQWAAAAGIELVEYDIYPDLPARDRLTAAPLFGLDSIKDGTIAVPDRPGLGIEIDEDAFGLLPYTSGATYAEVFRQHEIPAERRKVEQT
jgi:L-alanine-DL-glutamate epimerase-like enolase superfamily enzyme